ncbi:MAG: hypothetical protein ACJ73S_02810 [Mycobacteriales bacterium]
MTATATEARLVTCPGPELPAPPAFALTVPEGYLAHPAPGLLAIVEPEARVEPFQPNVTIAADLVPATTRPAEVLDRIQAGTARSRPGTTIGSHTPPDAPGVPPIPVATRRLRVPVGEYSPDPYAVEQVLTVLMVPARGGLAYAFTVAATWRPAPAGTPDQDGATLRAIHESFRVTGPGATSPTG